mmetsp:Transcript_58627/g.131041  ORF Transcript_58627/g.131041 Transcript_58627/m.131041 type:complete len:190 (-) Transcript_58627:61-630(-)
MQTRLGAELPQLQGQVRSCHLVPAHVRTSAKVTLLPCYMEQSPSRLSRSSSSSTLKRRVSFGPVEVIHCTCVVFSTTTDSEEECEDRTSCAACEDEADDNEHLHRLYERVEERRAQKCVAGASLQQEVILEPDLRASLLLRRRNPEQGRAPQSWHSQFPNEAERTFPLLYRTSYDGQRSKRRLVEAEMA